MLLPALMASLLGLEPQHWRGAQPALAEPALGEHFSALAAPPHGLPHSLPSVRNASWATVEALALTGQPALIADFSAGWQSSSSSSSSRPAAMLNWSCARFRREWPEGRMRAEYAEDDFNSDVALAEPGWAEVPRPSFGWAARRGVPAGGAMQPPALAPYIWHIKHHDALRRRVDAVMPSAYFYGQPQPAPPPPPPQQQQQQQQPQPQPQQPHGRRREHRHEAMGAEAIAAGAAPAAAAAIRAARAALTAVHGAARGARALDALLRRERVAQGETLEAWMSPRGAGAQAHADGYCTAVLSVQLCGVKRWRLSFMPPLRSAADKFDEFDGGIHRADNADGGARWAPGKQYGEVLVRAGQALLFPPGLFHETAMGSSSSSSSSSSSGSDGDADDCRDCGTSLTYQSHHFSPALLTRSFLPRLMLSQELAVKCADSWAPFQTLWPVGRVVPAAAPAPGAGAAASAGLAAAVQAHVDLTLSAADGDGDGALSAPELLEHARRAHLGLAAATAAGDGGDGGGGTQFDAAKEAEAYALCRDMLAFHDEDSDGELSQEELHASLRRWHAALARLRETVRFARRFGRSDDRGGEEGARRARALEQLRSQFDAHLGEKTRAVAGRGGGGGGSGGGGGGSGSGYHDIGFEGIELRPDWETPESGDLGQLRVFGSERADVLSGRTDGGDSDNGAQADEEEGPNGEEIRADDNDDDEDDHGQQREEL